MEPSSTHPPDRQVEYRRRGLWAAVTLTDRLTEYAARLGTKTAIIDPQHDDLRFSYERLHHDASQAAAFLAARGVGSGDVVSVQLPNRYESVVAMLGVLLLGARLNPLLTAYRERELSHILHASGAKAVFTPVVHRGFDHVAMMTGVKERLDRDLLHIVIGDGADDVALDGVERYRPGRDSSDPVLDPVDPTAVSEIIFTSGTEATPKGVVHSEETVNSSVIGTYRHLDLQPDDIVWMPSPIGHSTGLNFGVRFAIMHGLTLVLQDRWEADEAIDLITRYRPTYTLAATTFLSDTVDAAARSGQRLPSLTTFGCGGAPVPPALVRQAEHWGIGALRLYGSTEALIVSWNRPGDPLEQRQGTDGPVLDAMEAQVVDSEGRPVPADVSGELLIRGPSLCHGFFDDPERTAASFTAEGWLRSGDLGMISDDGAITIVGRKKEIIIRGGMNIAPREIEDVLSEMPGVAQVAVTGFEDPRLGEIVCAHLVKATDDAEVTLEAVANFLEAQQFARYKLPQRLEIVDALPQTTTGKTKRVELRLRAESRASAGDPDPVHGEDEREQR